MKNGFYLKIAWSNIKKNYRFFIPRILSEMGILACIYISFTLTTDKRVVDTLGGAYIPFFMTLATSVLAILSIILMFYINSFIMKQRKKEFGMYNILGMEKKHIGKVLFHETAICSIISIILGVGLGILFYKLCSLLICKLLQTEVIIGFYYISLKTILPVALAFILLDLLIYFVNRINIRRMKVVDLLKAKSKGEKEPKVKWVMLILGVLLIGFGYYISITVQNPLAVLGLFFVAVIAVVLGTYFIFVTGVTFILKTLKKNKKYYYNKKHMPSVSGLLFRMKQNAVGLATIAILATGVLVMISTTVSLYAGYNDILKTNYPQDMYVEAHYENKDGNISYVNTDKLIEFVDSSCKKNNIEIEKKEASEYLFVSFYIDGNDLIANQEIFNETVSAEHITNYIFITEDSYKELGGNALNLKENEIALCRIASPAGNIREIHDYITLDNKRYEIKEQLYHFPISAPMMFSMYNCYGIVVNDQTTLDNIYEFQKESYGQAASTYSNRVAVNFADKEKAGEAIESLTTDIKEQIKGYIFAQNDYAGNDKFEYSVDNYWESKVALTSMFGTLLFLGIILGTVCLFATVLIIYYKQISEGYEDRDRFQIMQKVGMSEKEVKKTINSQILIIFFLPLIVAAIHLVFAFPMLLKLLKIFLLTNTTMFVMCSIITFVVFALIYTLIYILTSKTYYKIVK